MAMDRVKHNTLFSTLKNSFIHFFNKYLLSTYYVSGSVLSSRESIVNIVDKALDLWNLPWQETFPLLLLLWSNSLAVVKNLDLEVWITNFVSILNIWGRRRNKRSQRTPSEFMRGRPQAYLSWLSSKDSVNKMM